MIKVYSADWCPYCHAEMEWLDDLGIKYEEVNIEQAGIKVESLPTTKIGDETIIGFDRPRIKKALKKNGLL